MFVTGLLFLYVIRWQFILAKIKRRISHSLYKINDYRIIRETVPYWQRTQYYIGDREIEATDYWSDYHRRRLRRLNKVLSNRYKYVNSVRSTVRSTVKFTVRKVLRCLKTCLK